MRERLTKRIIDRLIEERRNSSLLVWDREVPGLVLRLRPDGAPAFAYQYKLRGRAKQVRLGAYGPMTLDQARELARGLYVRVRAGGDPVADRRARRQRRITLGQLCELYLRDLRERVAAGAKRGRTSTLAEFSRVIEKRILPGMGATSEAESIDLETAEAWHRSMAMTPASANRALTVLSAVLRFAERRGLRPAGSNPCTLIEELQERPKRVRLSLDQLAALGEVMRQAEAQAAAVAAARANCERRPRGRKGNPGLHASGLLAIRILALTGMRRSEVTGHEQVARRRDDDGLRWGDVDLVHRVIQLRTRKAGSNLVPLGSAAVELLRSAKPENAQPHALVCPAARKARSDRRETDLPFVGVDNLFRRLAAKAGISGVGLHALRRTFASVAGDAGLGEFMVAALLGHTKGGTTGLYVIPGNHPLRQAAETVCSTIAAALAGQRPAPVVHIGGDVAARAPGSRATASLEPEPGAQLL